MHREGSGSISVFRINLFTGSLVYFVAIFNHCLDLILLNSALFNRLSLVLANRNCKVSSYKNHNQLLDIWT